MWMEEKNVWQLNREFKDLRIQNSWKSKGKRLWMKRERQRRSNVGKVTLVLSSSGSIFERTVSISTFSRAFKLVSSWILVKYRDLKVVKVPRTTLKHFDGSDFDLETAHTTGSPLTLSKGWENVLAKSNFTTFFFPKIDVLFNDLYKVTVLQLRKRLVKHMSNSKSK